MPVNKTKDYARKYAAGQNEHMDELVGEEDVWMVNGSAGLRCVILPIGSTEQEALQRYYKIYKIK